MHSSWYSDCPSGYNNIGESGCGFLGAGCKLLCQKCDAGTYVDGNGCYSCQPGKYKPNAGNSACSSCTAGHTCPTHGMTSQTACSAGRYENRGVCDICAAGKYQSNTGQTSCADCPKGTYCSNDGMGNPTKCPAGRFSIHTRQTSDVCSLTQTSNAHI